MGRKRMYRYFSCDFETTVYEGQKETEVWASACVELYTDDVQIFHSIGETFQYFKSLKSNLICYYHNLKFDGSFWLSYLLCDLKMEQATEKTGSGEYDIRWIKPEKMKNNTFQYSISDIGQWYTIKIMVNDYLIELRDSLKLLPFSVKEIGKAFNTKHRKTEMEYEGFRYAGCEITQSEKEYIANDVLVVKEALEFMFSEGHDRLTIGSCCLSEFKGILGKEYYAAMLPNLYAIQMGGGSSGEWIRKSYKGGWCYVCRGKENRIFHGGTTADVNSLYPSVMSSESKNLYPVGKPVYWEGNFIPDQAREEGKYYFVRIKTRFYLKEGKLPFMQIKGSMLYDGTECLESTDVVDKKTGEMCAYYTDFQGNAKSTRTELTFTCTEYKLFLEHYNVVEFEILDGCYFDAVSGLFDEYIERYKKIKMENKGAMRTLAKLFLNNLYGKMASTTDSSFKFAYEKEDGTLGFVGVEAYDKIPGYVAIGSAITGYARDVTIRAAQKNYHGKDERGFIYADTDSIHCDLPPDEIEGITVDENKFGCWKLESCWDEAIFVRPKTYIEHVTHEDLEALNFPYYNIKCAGLPERCNSMLQFSLSGSAPDSYVTYRPEEEAFIREKRTIGDFKVGLRVPGKLVPKRVKGGVLLVTTDFELRP